MGIKRRIANSSSTSRWAETAATLNSSTSTSALINDNNTIGRTNNPYDYVEEYGNDDDGGKKRGIFGSGSGRVGDGAVISGPMICLWSCRKTFINTVTFSVVSMISSFVAMQLIDSVLVMVSSTLTIGIGLLVLFQRRKIKQMGTLRRQHNDLRRKANYFVQERERLHRTLQRMDEKMASLSTVPAELKRLGQKGTANYDRLVTVVEEQEAVQEAIRKKIRQRVMQSIMSVCVQADKNDDFALTNSEIDVLVSRLKLIEHVEFHEERFRAILLEDSTIKSILKVIRSLIEKEDEYERGEPVFRLTVGDGARDDPSSTKKEKSGQVIENDGPNAVYLI
jgi:hypothetical protein